MIEKDNQLDTLPIRKVAHTANGDKVIGTNHTLPLKELLDIRANYG